MSARLPDPKPNRYLSMCLTWTAQEVRAGRQRAEAELDWLARVAMRDLQLAWTDALDWVRAHLAEAIDQAAAPNRAMRR